MTIISLVLALAADLKAKDYPKLVADFLALLQLLATAGVPTPKPQIFMQQMAAALPTTSADVLAGELEAFAAAHTDPSAGMHATASALDWKGLLNLVVKLLPFILGGL